MRFEAQLTVLDFIFGTDVKESASYHKRESSELIVWIVWIGTECYNKLSFRGEKWERERRKKEKESFCFKIGVSRVRLISFFIEQMLPNARWLASYFHHNLLHWELTLKSQTLHVSVLLSISSGQITETGYPKLMQVCVHIIIEKYSHHNEISDLFFFQELEQLKVVILAKVKVPLQDSWMTESNQSHVFMYTNFSFPI